MKKVSLKMVVLADYGVGRTCMLIRAYHQLYPDDYIPTCLDTESIDIPINAETTGVVECYDPTGGEYFPRLRPLYYPHTNVFVLAFSVESHASFQSIKQTWIKEIRQFEPTVPVILVGTKSDLRSDKETIEKLQKMNQQFITYEEGEELAHDIDAVIYLECSAKSGEGVDAVLQNAAKVAYGHHITKLKKRRKCAIL